ncbi:hypothetical protein BDK51DRAFT_32958 [Blyttiomyces helicus]|uniref:Uncharacterized protein n=1 Tax=Blyttiomyces helicus TaxID=388810 RepID=A0A4P9WQK8_9FUNG|nr:hypothetical protein BDK51DRAFT_32958 [Blyttiomyces helicus]|eukprot:RKO94463.1 hypothetical protein BDK51DRAFT_32958 [Blyttiomyces helicus]
MESKNQTIEQEDSTSGSPWVRVHNSIAPNGLNSSMEPNGVSGIDVDRIGTVYGVESGMESEEEEIDPHSALPALLEPADSQAAPSHRNQSQEKPIVGNLETDNPYG